jgi:hypothetical protein
MALQTFSFAANANTGAPSGEYVPADVAGLMAQTLSKLVWTVLYGKSHEASSAAVAAEQVLSSIRAGKAVA